MGKTVYLTTKELELLRAVFVNMDVQEDEAEEKLVESIMRKVSK